MTQVEAWLRYLELAGWRRYPVGDGILVTSGSRDAGNPEQLLVRGDGTCLAEWAEDGTVCRFDGSTLRWLEDYGPTMFHRVWEDGSLADCYAEARLGVHLIAAAFSEPLRRLFGQVK